jgi:glutathione S-transferase
LLLMLADRHPEAGLAAPPGSAKRNALYQWLFYMSSMLGASFRDWFYPSDLGAPEHPAAVRAALAKRIEGAWARLDSQLAAGGPYLLGEQRTAADLLLIMYMRWSRNMPKSALEWPTLLPFAKLMRGRKSWQQLCDIEKLEEWRS